MKYFKKITFIFVLVGACNWGLYGLFDFDIVHYLLGSIPVLARILYVLVGLSALYIILNKYTVCVCSCSCASETCTCKNDCECVSKNK